MYTTPLAVIGRSFSTAAALLLFATPSHATSPAVASLACIAASDAQFNAVIALDPSAATIVERQQGPLAGMPVLLKDNIESIGLPTTAGSLALAGNNTGVDAPLVAQLRAAGAVILGKANLSEWANFRSEHSSSGWSAIGGQTHNAHDTTRNPCGSSSGSAVAVARGYVPMAVGTETSGSIVCPAAINGVVGFKPTQGLVSGAGIVPLAPTQDTAGPIANSVSTAAQTLAVMADPGISDGAPARAGLAQYDALESLKGKRIGVWSASRGFDPRRDRQLDAVIASLKADGADVIEGMAVERYEGFGEDSYSVLLYEFRQSIAHYLASRAVGVNARSLDDLIAFNETQATAELSVFDQSIFLKAQALEDDEATYQARLARIRQAMRQEGLARLFTEYRLDAIVGLSGSIAWKTDPINGDAWFGPGMAGPAAIAGNPHITLPLAEVGGLPLGISLYGQRWADHRLAQIAYRLEQIHPKPHYRWAAGTPTSISPHCLSR